jgi:hypothetical protein
MSIDNTQSYYVVGLKNEEIARGALTQIAEPIRNFFWNTGEAVRKGELRGAEEKWAIIRFDPRLLDVEERKDEYRDLGYDEILYLNEEAWNVIKGSGLKVNFIEKIEKLPNEEMGIYISMPYWV